MVSNLLKRDEGFAIATVLGIAALITAVAVGGFWMAGQTVHESVRNNAETKAFQVANSGLELELATFDPTNIDAGRYPYIGNTSDGAYTLNVQQLAGYEYLLSSTGVSGDTSETVVQRFFYMNIWDMNIAAGSNSGFGVGNNWNGNANINGPFYVRGDFSWTSGNPMLTGGPLMVKDGAIDMSGGSGQVGTAANRIRCYATDGLIPLSALNSKVFPTDDIVRTSVPDIQLPRIDEDYLDSYLQMAMDQSVDNLSGTSENPITECAAGDPTTYLAVLPGRSPMAATVPASTSSYYKYRGSSGGRAAMGAGTHDLSIGPASFGAWDGHGYPAGSGLHDDFAYDAANHVLYVEGVVFIDGDLTFTTWVNYRGNGMLVVNGDTYIASGDLLPDGGFAVDRSLGITTPGSVYLNSTTYKGSVYCNGELNMDHPSTAFEGTVLADSISGDSPNVTLTQNPIIKDILPESMPGAGGGFVFPGTWTRR